MARLGARFVLLIALVIQAWLAARATRIETEFRAATRAYDAGDPVAALATFRRLGPDGPLGHRVAAWQGDAALAALDVAGGSSPEVRTRLLDDGWRGYGAAVARCPTDSWSWSGLSEVALRRAAEADRMRSVDLAELEERAHGILDGERAVALGAARIAVTLKPSGYQELDVLAAVYESLGDAPSAAKAYEDSARMMPAPSFHVWGDRPIPVPSTLQAVTRGVEEGLKAAPSYERSLLNSEIGRFLEMEGDRAAALAHFRESWRTAGNDYERFYGAYETARLLIASDDTTEALALLDEADRTGFGPASIHRLRASALSQRGDFGRACAEFVAVLRESPKDAPLRIQAARACETGNEPGLAERILREGFVLPSDNPTVAHEFYDYLIRSHRRAMAESVLQSWMRDDSDFAPLRNWEKESRSSARNR